MKQVVLLKGGDAKENYKNFYDFLEKQEFNPYKEVKERWNRNLGKILGEDYEVLEIPIFDKYFAEYKTWKIMFKKVFSYLKDDIIFVGHSMGGIFLAKYFEEENNKELSQKIKKIILIAPPFKDSDLEKLGTFNFKNLEFKNLFKIQEKIIILGSTDDFVVPFGDIEDYKKYLPNIKYRIFDNYGHFLGEKIPEIIEEIKN